MYVIFMHVSFDYMHVSFDYMHVNLYGQIYIMEENLRHSFKSH